MTKKTYSEKLKDPRWQKKRLKIMERDNFSCTCCLDNKSTLQIHHLSYKGNPWDVEDNQLITLCEDCHKLQEHLKTYSSDNIFGRIFKRVNEKGCVQYAVQLSSKTNFSDQKTLALFFKDNDDSYYSPKVSFRQSFIDFLSESIKSL